MKKLLAVILAGVMVLSLAACGGGTPKGEKLSMTVKKSGSQTGEMYAADVYYEPAEAITVDSPYENQQHIKNTENNTLVKFDLYSDSTYTNNKNKAKEDDDYKEIKIGDYDGYAYSYSKNTYRVFVRFEGIDEPAMQNCFMKIEVKPADNDMDTEAAALYESEYVQNIVKTLTFGGIVAPESE